MKYVILDIETAPHHPEILRAAGWSPSRSYPSAGPGESEEDHWMKWHGDTAQLDPARSWVCAIGLGLVRDDDSLHCHMLSAPAPHMEADVLRRAGLVLGGGLLCDGVMLDPAQVTLVGHNIAKFDLPYLRARSLYTGVEGDVRVAAVLDTKAHFEHNYQVRHAASSSLDCIARACRLQTKPGSGKDYWLMPPEQQRDYLHHDLRTTWQIARLFGLIPDPVPDPAPECSDEEAVEEEAHHAPPAREQRVETDPGETVTTHEGH